MCGQCPARWQDRAFDILKRRGVPADVAQADPPIGREYKPYVTSPERQHSMARGPNVQSTAPARLIRLSDSVAVSPGSQRSVTGEELFRGVTSLVTSLAKNERGRHACILRNTLSL